MNFRMVVCIALAVLLSAGSSSAETLREQLHLRGYVHPKAIIDPEGAIFVADGGNNRVIKYSARGDSLIAVSGSGWGNDQFDAPSGLALRGVDLFVSDYGNHRIQRFDRNLNFVATLYTRENIREDERFGYPRGVAISPQGDMYVIDGENFRIIKINPFAQVERAFGSTDAGANRLVDPVCVCAEQNGMVDVVDQGTLKRFDAFGTPRGILPVQHPQWCAASGDGFSILTDSTLMRFSNTDPEPHAVRLPADFSWRGCSINGTTLALWTDTDVVIYAIQQ